MGRRIRLIHGGRLLADGTLVHSWLDAVERRQKRAVAADPGDDGEPLVSRVTWLHCSVGPTIESNTGDYDGDTAQVSWCLRLIGWKKRASYYMPS